jgi:hypothetical protein
VQQEHHQHQPTTKRAGSAPPPEDQESDDEEVVVVAVTAVEHGSDDADASRDQHSSSSTSKASSITRDINNKKREHEEESQAPTSTSPGASTSTASTVNKNYSETLWNNVPRSRTFLATVSADAKRIEVRQYIRHSFHAQQFYLFFKNSLKHCCIHITSGLISTLCYSVNFHFIGKSIDIPSTHHLTTLVKNNIRRLSASPLLRVAEMMVRRRCSVPRQVQGATKP